MNHNPSSKAGTYEGEAPGRLDVMGGIADYSGSLLLQMPIRYRTHVKINSRSDGQLHIRSYKTALKFNDCNFPVQELADKSYEEIRAWGRSIPESDWASYVYGCLAVLHVEKNVPLKGLDIIIQSEVPEGKGVSSSAALEVATLKALTRYYGLELDRTELPLLAQRAENLIVGAPCGLMDQLSTYLGRKGMLLPICCQPHEVFDPIKIPKGMYFDAIDSGIRHAVSGSSYTDVRISAFMGYSLIARQEGLSAEELGQARIDRSRVNLPYNGYLSNIPLAHFHTNYREGIPEKMTGAAFLKSCGQSIDAVTSIDPDKIYSPLACTLHPVEENHRIQIFQKILSSWPKQVDRSSALRELGELMYASHRSYSAVGLGNENTDALVSLAQEYGPEHGVYGARVSGGGSGGTVAFLCYGAPGRAAVREIASRYRKAYGIKAKYFQGSSDGGYYSHP
jgi:L-arabinokinase